MKVTIRLRCVTVAAVALWLAATTLAAVALATQAEITPAVIVATAAAACVTVRMMLVNVVERVLDQMAIEHTAMMMRKYMEGGSR